MMGFGASSLILGNVAGILLEPDALGWRNTYLVFGILIAIVLALTGLLIRLPSEGTVFPQTKQAPAIGLVARDYTTAEMVRRFSFWRYFLFAVTMTVIGNTVISFARNLALSVRSSAALATTLVGVLSICNGLGRILIGFSFDTLGRRKTMLLANVLTIAAPLMILAAVLCDSIPLCVVGICLSGLSYGCSPPIASTFVSEVYGTKHFAMNFSVANSMLIPTAFVATIARSMVTSTGSYIAPAVLLLVLVVISLLLDLSIQNP